MVHGSPEVEEGRSVLILGDRIVKIGASGSIDVPQGVEVVDGQGQTLIPGLIDAHIHLSDETELAGYLAHCDWPAKHVRLPVSFAACTRHQTGRNYWPRFHHYRTNS
jgi:cytosine/adenosine deaminase-related metal-dependent hydrolase